MLKLLLGVVVEVLIAIALAGVILALAIPLMNRYELANGNDRTSRVVITAVLVGAIAVALCRPGSATHRYIKR